MYLDVPMNGTEPNFERVPQQGFIGDALRYVAVGDATVKTSFSA